MQKPEHRFHLPKPDMGDRWSEDMILDVERKWRNTLSRGQQKHYRDIFDEGIAGTLRAMPAWPPFSGKSLSLAVSNPALAKVCSANYDDILSRYISKYTELHRSET